MRRMIAAAAVSLFVASAGLVLLMVSDDDAPRAAENRLDLLAPATKRVAVSAAPLSVVLRSREVDLRSEDIERLFADPNLESVFLGLFADTELTVEIVSRRSAASDPTGETRTLSGRVAGDRHSTARLSVEDGRLDALISAENQLFRITPTQDGRHRISELSRTPPNTPGNRSD